MDVIDREQALKLLNLNKPNVDEKTKYAMWQFDKDFQTIKTMPSSEKTGKWLRLNDDKSVLGCSVCGKWACLSNYINEGEKGGQFKSPYCPYCGAKMIE